MGWCVGACDFMNACVCVHVCMHVMSLHEDDLLYVCNSDTIIIYVCTQ